ncbi:hypothetical protein U879_07255, partial [Defluviimonas sp. 20V17]
MADKPVDPNSILESKLYDAFDGADGASLANGMNAAEGAAVDGAVTSDTLGSDPASVRNEGLTNTVATTASSTETRNSEALDATAPQAGTDPSQLSRGTPLRGGEDAPQFGDAADAPPPDAADVSGPAGSAGTAPNSTPGAAPATAPGAFNPAQAPVVDDGAGADRPSQDVDGTDAGVDDGGLPGPLDGSASEDAADGGETVTEDASSAESEGTATDEVEDPNAEGAVDESQTTLPEDGVVPGLSSETESPTIEPATPVAELSELVDDIVASVPDPILPQVPAIEDTVQPFTPPEAVEPPAIINPEEPSLPETPAVDDIPTVGDFTDSVEIPVPDTPPVTDQLPDPLDETAPPQVPEEVPAADTAADTVDAVTDAAAEATVESTADTVAAGTAPLAEALAPGAPAPGDGTDTPPDSDIVLDASLAGIDATAEVTLDPVEALVGDIDITAEADILTPDATPEPATDTAADTVDAVTDAVTDPLADTTPVDASLNVAVMDDPVAIDAEIFTAPDIVLLDIDAAILTAADADAGSAGSDAHLYDLLLPDAETTPDPGMVEGDPALLENPDAALSTASYDLVDPAVDDLAAVAGSIST